MGNDNGDSKISKDKCPYLSSKEDYWGTTSYPICTCGFKHCKEDVGYCPIYID